ncbi:helix-turn-helix domain-containing protein [Nocardia mexicana]|uniref:Helix-turn-helix protein n=1 Tax=Nocardia mexicana TaxID=279262 RepID=A0A370H1U3_9NOCA|nr:helix-turn-helix transcriptional regulator [Nocardia mexicana]RDI49807.1 helix-turn-helix protein [Nocardia mexicana]
MTEDDQPSTLTRRQLGRLLREAREGIGLTIQKAAPLVELSKSALQRMEAGEVVRIRVRDVQALCELYEMSPEETKRAVELAEQAQVKSWYTAFGGLYSDSTFNMYVGLESAAEHLVVYNEIIPGLLQTADYARELISAYFQNKDPEDIARRVELRMRRQAIVTRKAVPVKLEVLLHESALHRLVGGPQVMATVLRHVAETSKRPNVSLRILPFSAGVIWGLLPETFSILQFGTDAKGKPVEPPLVYLEGSASTNDLYLEKPDDVRRYQRLVSAMQDASLDETKSRDLLRQVARRYEA